MTFPELKEKIEDVLEPAVDTPDRWIDRYDEEIRKAATREGAQLFLGALTLCIVQTPGELSSFFDDYPGHLVKYLRGEETERKARRSGPGDDFTTLDRETERMLRDPEEAERIRGQGEDYLQGDEWTAFRRRVGLGPYKREGS